MASTKQHGAPATGRLHLSRVVGRSVGTVDTWVRAQTVDRLAPADRVYAATKAAAVSRWLDRATRYRVWFLTQGHLNCIAELFEQGAHNEARVACEEVIADCTALGKPSLGPAARAHGERARCLQWADRLDEAVDEFELVLGDEACVASIGERWELRYRYCLAMTLRDLGDLEGSSALLRALVPEMVSVFGQDSPWMVSTVAQLAKNVARSGDPATAIEMVSSLLPSTMLLRGPMSMEALTLRSKVARWTLELGDRQFGHQAASRALMDFTRAGQATCAESCELRFDYARSLRDGGEVDYAAAQLASLVHDLDQTSFATSAFAASVRATHEAWRTPT